MEDIIIESVTKIANVLLKKKHPEVTIRKWETEYILEALYLLMGEEEDDLSENS